MLKLLTACAVLCIFSSTGARAEYNVTKLELKNPYSITGPNELFILWLDDGYLYINKTNGFGKLCEFRYNYNLQRIYKGIQVKNLGDGRRFVTWGIAQQVSWEAERTKKRGYTTSYRMILVNPSSCDYESVELPAFETERKDPNKEENPLPYGDIIVVTYADSFDVFFPGHRNCSPCRYDMEGKKVDLDYQLEFSSPDLAPYVTPKGIHMQVIDSAERKYGYFFARNFENNTAVIELLDEHFKTVKRLYVNHPVHSVSITGTIWHERRISVCFASHNVYPVVSPDHLEVHCRQFDTDFQPKLSIRIPVNKNTFVFGMLDLTHLVDSFGNTYVGLIESSNRRARTHDSSDKSSPRDYDYYNDVESRQFRYFAYDITGKLLESHDLEKVDRLVNARNRSNGLYSLLLIGKKICMDNHDFISNNVYEIKSYLTSRCFDISNYRPLK